MPLAQNRTPDPELDVDRRQADALLETGAIQRAMCDSGDFLCIATDVNGIIRIFNVGAERMLGYGAAELLGRISLADLTDPQDLIERARALSVELGTPIVPGFDALVFKASRDSEDTYELIFTRKGGSHFSTLVSAAALRDVHGSIVGYLLISIDDTARQRREAERARLDQRLRDQQFYTRSLIESNIDALIAIDPQGTITDVNEEMEALTGCTRNELFGTSFKHHFTHPARAEAAIIRVLNEGKVTNYELTLRAEGGRDTAVSFNARTFYDRKRTLQGVFASVRDVTHRKRVEEQAATVLRELNDVKAAIDQHALVGITDCRGKITYVNDNFCAISKFSREELLGRDHRITSSGFHSKEFIRNIWQTISDGRVWRGEIKNKAKDGTFYWVDTTIVPYLDEDRQPFQFIAIRADITERKRFERLLQEKNVELADANRMKSEFLANMSHELRTPLNAIIGFSEVLSDGLVGDMPDRQRGFVGEIFSSGQHLLSLINEILDLSKVEAGKMVLDLESTQVWSLLENALLIMREKAATGHVTLSIEAAGNLGAILADPRKVKQIVYNLLANAVKFTPDGGHVTLRAGRVSRARVAQLSGIRPGLASPLADSEFAEFLELTVTDSGIGISPEHLDRLFTPFSQIDGGLARRFEGTGLGLTMVKLLAELHGGAVAVESSAGEGSCFSVWLPLRSVATAPASDHAAKAVSD